METIGNSQAIDRIIGKEGIGAQLLGWWRDLPTLLRNLDAVQELTPRQKERLRAATGLHFVYEERAQLRSPADAWNAVRQYENEPQEHMLVIVLDTRNRIVHVEDVYKGSLNMSVIRVAELFRPAIVWRAAAIIIAHNHPSGDPSPSPEDVSVTRNIIHAGQLLDIDVLDHIVIGAGHFVSLKERGLAFQ